MQIEVKHQKGPDGPFTAETSWTDWRHADEMHRRRRFQSRRSKFDSSGGDRPSIGLTFFNSSGCWRIQPTSERVRACGAPC